MLTLTKEVKDWKGVVHKLEMTIDEEKLFEVLGTRAIANKNKHSEIFYGVVTCKVKK